MTRNPYNILPDLPKQSYKTWALLFHGTAPWSLLRFEVKMSMKPLAKSGSWRSAAWGSGIQMGCGCDLPLLVDD